ncbi:MAG: hypothetical protein UX17_C0024G0007, partial [Parcubacteria group bacterium GW2011_GWC2_45_7]
ALLEKETLEQAEFEAFFGGQPVPQPAAQDSGSKGIVEGKPRKAKEAKEKRAVPQLGPVVV